VLGAVNGDTNATLDDAPVRVTVERLT